MGIEDIVLSECLQLDSGLTLEKAKKLVRQKEAVKGQHQLLNNARQDQTTIDTVRKTNKTCHRGIRNSSPANNCSKSPGKRQPCKRCSKEHGPADRCPVKKATYIINVTVRVTLVCNGFLANQPWLLPVKLQLTLFLEQRALVENYIGLF